MARYKVIDTSPRFIAVDLQRQLVPGTFEHALNYLIDHEIDLSGFDGRYRNDTTGSLLKFSSCATGKARSDAKCSPSTASSCRATPASRRVARTVRLPARSAGHKSQSSRYDSSPISIDGPLD